MIISIRASTFPINTQPTSIASCLPALCEGLRMAALARRLQADWVRVALCRYFVRRTPAMVGAAQRNP